MLVSSYFDPTNYTKPVQYFMDDSFHYMSANTSIYMSTFYQKDLLTLNDNIFGLFSSQIDDYFYTFSYSDIEVGPWLVEGVPDLFNQDIRLDKMYDTYNRQVYTITMVLSEVGGFYSSLQHHQQNLLH